jgi:hypothetical protein
MYDTVSHGMAVSSDRDGGKGWSRDDTAPVVQRMSSSAPGITTEFNAKTRRRRGRNATAFGDSHKKAQKGAKSAQSCAPVLLGFGP